MNKPFVVQTVKIDPGYILRRDTVNTQNPGGDPIHIRYQSTIDVFLYVHLLWTYVVCLTFKWSLFGVNNIRFLHNPKRQCTRIAFLSSYYVVQISRMNFPSL